jgi:hypothetical protein
MWARFSSFSPRPPFHSKLMHLSIHAAASLGLGAGCDQRIACSMKLAILRICTNQFWQHGLVLKWTYLFCVMKDLLGRVFSPRNSRLTSRPTWVGSGSKIIVRFLSILLDSGLTRGTIHPHQFLHQLLSLIGTHRYPDLIS